MHKYGMIRVLALMNLDTDKVMLMDTTTVDCTEELHNEIDQTPEEYRPLLLRIVHSFREGVSSTQARRLIETQEALDDIKAGRVIDGDKVMSWLDTWGTDAEQAAPKQ